MTGKRAFLLHCAKPIFEYVEGLPMQNPWIHHAFIDIPKMKSGDWLADCIEVMRRQYNLL